jgi:hypothetical protein
MERLYSRGISPTFGCYALEDQEEDGVEDKKITAKTLSTFKTPDSQFAIDLDNLVQLLGH